MKSDAVRAFLGIGGNVGDVVANMRTAIRFLDAHPEIKVVEVSPVYQTPPWGKEDQDWFLNACLVVETHLAPVELLEHCLAAETRLNRQRTERWGPRTIDLDILIYGDSQIDEPGLQIPHPRMAERAFVLKPLADLDRQLEISGETVGHLLEKIPHGEINLLELPPGWWREGTSSID